jgi:hypothetical protein
MAAFAGGQEPSNETVNIVKSQILQLTKQSMTSSSSTFPTVNSALDGDKNNVKDGGTTTSTSIMFTFSTNSAAGFQCFLDGKGAMCSSPVIYNKLIAGLHTFQVLTVDKFKNVSKNPVTFTWSIEKPK